VVKLPACVQNGHYDLRGANPSLVDTDGNTSPVVFDRHRSVKMDGDVHPTTESSQVLVDRIIDNLPNKVMEPRSIVDVADVHPRSLANSLEPLEHRDIFTAIT
jgi:hypothetical protein